jgi:hypothetical protein
MLRINAYLVVALLASPVLAGNPAQSAGEPADPAAVASTRPVPLTGRQMGADSALFTVRGTGGEQADPAAVAKTRPVAMSRQMGADSALFADRGTGSAPEVADLGLRWIYGTSAGE